MSKWINYFCNTVKCQHCFELLDSHLNKMRWFLNIVRQIVNWSFKYVRKIVCDGIVTIVEATINSSYFLHALHKCHETKVIIELFKNKKTKSNNTLIHAKFRKFRSFRTYHKHIKSTKVQKINCEYIDVI